MKECYDLHQKIREYLSKGGDFSDGMFGKELDAACVWLTGIRDRSEPEVLEKIPKIVALIRECGTVAEERGYEFLAAEFKGVADAVEDALEIEG